MTITPEQLREYIATMQAAGITGPAKIGDIEITIPPPGESASGDAPTRRSAKKEYDTMLFAATEGIPDDEATS